MTIMKTPYIIAEIGFNHGGSLKLAERMIRAAAKSGANAVKFQSYKVGDICLPSNKYYNIVKTGELTVEDHRKLKKLADTLKIDFLSTPFSVQWVDILDRLGVKGFKVASMDMTNHLLLKAIAGKKKTVYLATGVGSLDEVKNSVKVMKKHGARDIVVLHCISNYPTKPEDIHLGFMSDIAKATNLPVGFSDHSLGVAAPLAAIALGATVIEKHFTLDKSLPGPDHQASLEPNELKDMVGSIRAVEQAMGNSTKVIRSEELDTKNIARKSLVATQTIKRGELFAENNIDTLRPGTGISAMYYWQYIGQKATKEYKMGELIDG